MATNPYDIDELKRRAQVQSLSSDEYYALNQANAKANPVAAPRPLWTTQAEYEQKYKKPYVGGTDIEDYRSANRMVKTGAIVAALGAGGAFGAGLLAGGGAAAGSGLGVKTAVDGTALGTGVATGGGAQAAAAGGGTAVAGGAKAATKIPWGKIGNAAVSTYSALTGEKPEQTFESPVSTPTTPTPTTTTAPAPTATQTQTQTPKAVPLVNSPPPPGWEAKNWSDPNMRTVKYDAGRLLYGATKPSEVAKIVASPAFQARFPGATFDGKDRIDFKGALSEGTTGTPVGVIDVLLSADKGTDTSKGLWWGFEPEGTGSSGAPMPMSMMTPTSTNPGASFANDNSTLARIMAELTAASQGTQSPTAREAILQLLGTRA